MLVSDCCNIAAIASKTLGKQLTETILAFFSLKIINAKFLVKHYKKNKDSD